MAQLPERMSDIAPIPPTGPELLPMLRLIELQAVAGLREKELINSKPRPEDPVTRGSPR
jgi:hypothetical protein